MMTTMIATMMVSVREEADQHLVIVRPSSCIKYKRKKSMFGEGEQRRDTVEILYDLRQMTS